MNKKFEQDKFRESFDKANTINRTLEDRLKERSMNQRMGRPTGSVDTVIRYEIGNAEFEFKILDRLAHTYTNYPNQHTDIAPSEKTKRVQQIQELRNKLDKTLAQARQALGLAGNQALTLAPSDDLETNPLQDKYTTEGKDNRQLLNMQKQMLRDQDDRLEEVDGVIRVIKHENEDFGKEVNLQTKMLTGLNQRVEKTTNKMQRLNDRLASMVAKRSTMFYYAIIAVEVLAILLVLSF